MNQSDLFSDRSTKGNQSNEMVLKTILEALEDAGIDLEDTIAVESGEGKVTITHFNILDELPEDLLKLYDKLGIPRKVVKEVLEREFVK